MSSRAIRYIHAGDFHLEQPMHGLDLVPDHLRDLLVDAPLKAAERVFEAAVLEEVDFVLLTGDILDAESAGPRAIDFLLHHFETLREHDITVYWAGGRVDPPDRWPELIPLPQNVRVFPRGHVDETLFLPDDDMPVMIAGTSSDGRLVRGADFRVDPAHLTIAVAHGRCEMDGLSSQGVHYWALGGEHQRRTVFDSPHVAHYAGTPQGRCPEEEGAHGCTLVTIDADRRVRLQFVPTDVVRFHQETLSLGKDVPTEELERRIAERLRDLAHDAADHPVLVSWRIEGSGRLVGGRRNPGAIDELLQRLRDQYGHGARPTWSASLEFASADAPPAHYYEEDTLLGDYLRAIRDRAHPTGERFDVESQLPERHAHGPLASLVTLPDGAERTRVFHEAAVLGVSLLRGDA